MSINYDVFISHSTANRRWATDFATKLKDNGLTVFYDVWSVAPGQQFEDAIRQGLRDSKSVVVVFDQSSVGSAWSAFEVGAAIGTGKQVVPVLADDVAVDRLPGPVRDLQSIRVASPTDAADEVAKLVRGEGASVR